MPIHFCLAVLVTVMQSAPAASPHAAVAELLDSDRRFAAAARQQPAVEAIAAMFAENVTAPVAGNRYVQGKAEVVGALRVNPDHVTGRVDWAPIRGGISGDGLHGFTFGYMTLTKVDGAKVPLKYLAYWIKGKDGWRVAAYRRRPRPEGVVSTETMPPSLPPRLVAPSTDAAAIDAHRRSLIAAEKAFSDEAQSIGIGAAFAKHGSADAVNMGGPKDVGFVVGSEAIGRSVGAGSPTDSSEVEWSADRAVVASSGDLGITFGMIRIKKPQPGGPATVPFFTIWRRNDAGIWRYIAE